MYPWYRDSQIGVGQFCNPVSAATIKTETGYSDCMLTFDYGTQAKVSRTDKTTEKSSQNQKRNRSRKNV